MDADALENLARLVAQFLGEERNRLIDRAELARRLGVSERTLRRGLDRKEIPPPRQIGDSDRWDWEEVKRGLPVRGRGKVRQRGRHKVAGIGG